MVSLWCGKLDREASWTLRWLDFLRRLAPRLRCSACNASSSKDGAVRDQRFWRLAQALSALYPGDTEEKRWVDGVLARKKALGF